MYKANASVVEELILFLYLYRGIKFISLSLFGIVSYKNTFSSMENVLSSLFYYFRFMYLIVYVSFAATYLTVYWQLPVDLVVLLYAIAVFTLDNTADILSSALSRSKSL